MVVVRWLEPDVAEDLALAPAVTEVVNRAYAHKEVGLFATKIERTDIDDVRTSISRRETAVALLEGAVVGSVRSRALDGRTGWFGALGVDPTVHGRGFGEALVRFVEDDAAAAGRAAMQLEVLESQPIHPHLSRVREWYERRGYRESSRLPLAALYPEDAARLLVAVMDVVTRHWGDHEEETRCDTRRRNVRTPDGRSVVRHCQPIDRSRPIGRSRPLV